MHRLSSVQGLLGRSWLQIRISAVVQYAFADGVGEAPVPAVAGEGARLRRAAHTIPPGRLALRSRCARPSVTPAFARTPPRNSNSTTLKNSRLRDHTARTKIVLLTELHSAEPLHNHLEDLQVIDFKTLSSEGKFNKRSLSAEEMKALKKQISALLAPK